MSTFDELVKILKEVEKEKTKNKASPNEKPREHKKLPNFMMFLEICRNPYYLSHNGSRSGVCAF